VHTLHAHALCGKLCPHLVLKLSAPTLCTVHTLCAYILCLHIMLTFDTYTVLPISDHTLCSDFALRLCLVHTLCSLFVLTLCAHALCSHLALCRTCSLISYCLIFVHIPRSSCAGTTHVQNSHTIMFTPRVHMLNVRSHQ